MSAMQHDGFGTTFGYKSRLARLQTAALSRVRAVATRVGWLRRQDRTTPFDQQAALSRQQELFRELGLSREEGQQTLVACCGDEYTPKKQSEHPLLLAAISRRMTCQRILEIGTHDGENARLLATLFPSAHITTIDLRDDDPVFRGTYKRHDAQFLSQFLNARAANLRSKPNITFRQMNSLELIHADDRYDVIWVDGAHGYPIVAIDIANALRLLADDGIMACDDVWVGRLLEDSDPLLKSCAPYDTLSALQVAGLVDFRLVYKRLVFRDVGRPATKHIAVVRHARTVASSRPDESR